MSKASGSIIFKGSQRFRQSLLTIVVFSGLGFSNLFAIVLSQEIEEYLVQLEKRLSVPEMGEDFKKQPLKYLQGISKYSSEKIGNPSFQELRRRETAALLSLVAKLDELDKAFEKVPLPEMNVSPPADSHCPAGVEPFQIEDPEMRARNSRDIEANRQVALRHSQAYHQLKSRRLTRAIIKSYIELLYKQEPVDDFELMSFLKSFSIKKELSETIIKNVSDGRQ